jgi:hypothetical protein
VCHESPLLPALVIDLMIHDFENLAAVAITPSQRETLKSLWLRYLLGLGDNDTDLFDLYDEETLWELVNLGLAEVEDKEWFLTGKGAQLAKILCRESKPGEKAEAIETATQRATKNLMGFGGIQLNQHGDLKKEDWPRYEMLLSEVLQLCSHPIG